MKKSIFKVQVIEAEAGKYLTQNADVPNSERVFSEKVFLAVNDSAENWRECTAEEKEAVEQALASENNDEYTEMAENE